MSYEWEIPDIKLSNHKLDKIIVILNKQNEKITDLENQIKNNNKKIEEYKKNINNQIKTSSLQYTEIIKILENNKNILKKYNKKDVNELNEIINKLKLNNKKIINNLSSAMFQHRNDNIFWRSFSNKNYPSLLSKILL